MQGARRAAMVAGMPSIHRDRLRAGQAVACDPGAGEGGEAGGEPGERHGSAHSRVDDAAGEGEAALACAECLGG